MPPTVASLYQANHRLILATCLLLVFRLISAVLIELTPQEAYYWNYALHPALSYFDHPPFIAWVINAGYFLLGKFAFAIRIGGIVLTVLSTGLLYLLGTLWFGQRAGLWAALLFQLVPLFFVYGVLITPDVPLIFFWLLTLYFLSRAVRDQRPDLWYLAGVAMGFCLLSKYPAVFLAFSAFLFLLADARYRPWLARKEPYLAACIALLIFTPVILWNIRHHWASFNFQVTERMNVETAHPLRRFMEFVLMQLGVTSPLLLAGLILTPAIPMSLGLKLRRSRWRFALIFALPLLIFLLGYSTRAAVKANWPAPAYLTLLIAAYPAYRYLRFNSGPRSRSVAGKFVTIWLWALPVMYLGAIYHSIIVFPGVPVHHWTTGWREMGDIVRAEADKLEASDGKRVFLIGLDTHYVASALTFYAGDKHPVFSRNLVGKRALAFEYWRPDLEPIGWNAVAVDFEPPVTEMLKRYFVRVDDQPERVPIRRGDRLLHYVYLVHCYGYKGKGSGTARRTGADLR